MTVKYVLRIFAIFTFIIIAAQVQAVDSALENRVLNLFVIGDSTASNGADCGWGSHLAEYFDTNKINVFNRARGGRSSRTFQTEGLWDKVLDEINAGDFVLIQFGHNDGGAINDNHRARGSIPGLGEQTL